MFLIFIFFGLAPSIIWLLFYLRKDSHPESNRMILKVFFYGMLIALVAALVEIGIFKIFSMTGISRIEKYQFLFFLLYNFIGIAMVEEFLKYFVVRQSVLNNPEFDEPVDVMLYMIIAALGFAALENIFVLFPKENFLFIDTVAVSGLRFIGATFLHALCSGTLGYFLALSIATKKNGRLLISGLLIASFLHGLYNLSIIEIENNSGFVLIPILIITSLAIFVSYGFRKLKTIKSTCEIK